VNLRSSTSEGKRAIEASGRIRLRGLPEVRHREVLEVGGLRLPCIEADDVFGVREA
jgi:hypothetical protein